MNRIQQFHSTVGTLVQKDVWNTDLPKVVVDNEYKKVIMDNRHRLRGSVRLREGLFNTIEEIKKMKKRFLPASSK